MKIRGEVVFALGSFFLCLSLLAILALAAFHEGVRRSKIGPLQVKEPCHIINLRGLEESHGKYIDYTVRCDEYTGPITPEGKIAEGK